MHRRPYGRQLGTRHLQVTTCGRQGRPASGWLRQQLHQPRHASSDGKIGEHAADDREKAEEPRTRAVDFTDAAQHVGKSSARHHAVLHVKFGADAPDRGERSKTRTSAVICPGIRTSLPFQSLAPPVQPRERSDSFVRQIGLTRDNPDVQSVLRRRDRARDLIQTDRVASNQRGT